MDTAPSHIYTLSLHDALPISGSKWQVAAPTSSRVADRSAHAVAYWVPHTPRHWNRALGTTVGDWRLHCVVARGTRHQDRKSTRLNSSHSSISYAVFCLKKKTK